MPRIPPADDLPVPPDSFSGSSSTMSTLFGVMAQRPAIAQAATQLLETTMRQGSVDSKLKELLAIRVSQVNHCHY